MTGKPDPAKQPIVHKLRGGGVIAWTIEIDAYFGRNRHDNILAACYKVRAADREFFAAHFLEGEYTAKNHQKYRCYAVDRDGCVAMLKYIGGVPDKKLLLLAAYDRKAEEAEKRKGQPDLDPATIPDDMAALEPAKPEDLARRYLEARGEPPTPERLAEVMHAMPPALEEYLPPLDEPVVHVDGMRAYATTMDIAAFFQKQHKNVLANVREIELLQPEFYRLNFQPITYLDSHGREQPAFEVTKAGFALAVGGFTGAKALEFRVRYIQRFEEMEAALKAQPAAPRTYGSAEELLNDHQAVAMLLAGYAGQVITLTAENTKLETQVSVLEPKAAALDRLADKNGTMNLRSAAKALGFGPDFFKRRLEQLDYLFREDGRLVAYQRHIDAGLFVHKPVVLAHRDGTEFVVSQPLVTARGLARLAVAFGVGVQAVLGQGVLHLNRDEGDSEALH